MRLSTLKNILIRPVAAVVTVTFFFTNLSVSNPNAFANEVYVTAQKFLPHLEIPAELGTLEELDLASDPNQTPFVIHLQTAHGSYEAQKKIEAILEHLIRKYGVEQILLEGAAGKLDPEMDRFFWDAKLNRQVLEFRAKQGQASGASLFLLDAPAKVEARGVERAPLYRENRRTFQKVFRAREEASHPLAELNREIENLRATVHSKPLREFLARLEAFEAKRFSLLNWFRYLRKRARENLGINLLNPAFQKDWPSLVRLARLEQIETELDPAKLQNEKEIFVKDMRRLLPHPLFQELKSLLESAQEDPKNGLSPYPYAHVRFLLERVVDSLPENYSFDRFPQLEILLQLLAFRNELEAPVLFEELERLSDEVQRSLTKDERTRDVLEILKDCRLLNRLFDLELTPGDYEKLEDRKRKVDFHLSPSAMKQIDSLIDLALEFYRGAKVRERAMAENISRLVQGSEKPVVVITGGFHAPGLREYFKNQNLSYALVTPKITEETSRQGYLDSILEKRPTLFREATIEDALAFPEIPPAILRRLGIDPEIAREFILRDLLLSGVPLDEEEIEELNRSRIAEVYQFQLRRRGSEIEILGRDGIVRYGFDSSERRLRKAGISAPASAGALAYQLRKELQSPSQWPKDQGLRKVSPQIPSSSSSSSFSSFSGVTSQPDISMAPARDTTNIRVANPNLKRKSDVTAAGTSKVGIFKKAFPSAFRLLGPNKDFIANGYFPIFIINYSTLVNNYFQPRAEEYPATPPGTLPSSPRSEARAEVRTQEFVRSEVRAEESREVEGSFSLRVGPGMNVKQAIVQAFGKRGFEMNQVRLAQVEDEKGMPLSLNELDALRFEHSKVLFVTYFQSQKDKFEIEKRKGETLEIQIPFSNKTITLALEGTFKNPMIEYEPWATFTVRAPNFVRVSDKKLTEEELKEWLNRLPELKARRVRPSPRNFGIHREIFFYDLSQGGKFFIIKIDRISFNPIRQTVTFTGPAALLPRRSEVRALSPAKQKVLEEAIDDALGEIFSTYSKPLSSDDVNRRVMRIHRNGQVGILRIDAQDSSVEQGLAQTTATYLGLAEVLKRRDVDIEQIDLEFDGPGNKYPEDHDKLRALLKDFLIEETRGNKFHTSLLGKYGIKEYSRSAASPYLHRIVLRRSEARAGEGWRTLTAERVKDLKLGMSISAQLGGTEFEGPVVSLDEKTGMLTLRVIYQKGEPLREDNGRLVLEEDLYSLPLARLIGNAMYHSVRAEVRGRRPTFTDEELIQTHQQLVLKLKHNPTLEELAKKLGVSKSTIGRRLQVLEKKGILLETKGSGRESKFTDEELIQTHKQLVRELGRNPMQRELAEKLAEAKKVKVTQQAVNLRLQALEERKGIHLSTRGSGAESKFTALEKKPVIPETKGRSEARPTTPSDTLPSSPAQARAEVRAVDAGARIAAVEYDLQKLERRVKRAASPVSKEFFLKRKEEIDTLRTRLAEIDFLLQAKLARLIGLEASQLVSAATLEEDKDTLTAQREWANELVLRVDDVEQILQEKSPPRSEVRAGIESYVVDPRSVQDPETFWRGLGWESIEMEIGSGRGQFLIQRAKQLLETHGGKAGIVGFELPEHALSEMDAALAMRRELWKNLSQDPALPNLRLLFENASVWARLVFEPGQISQIYIFFPYVGELESYLDPKSVRTWQDLFSRLAPGGRIHLVTDSQDYIDDLQATLKNLGLPNVLVESLSPADMPAEFPRVYVPPLDPQRVGPAKFYLRITREPEMVRPTPVPPVRRLEMGMLSAKTLKYLPGNFEDELRSLIRTHVGSDVEESGTYFIKQLLEDFQVANAFALQEGYATNPIFSRTAGDLYRELIQHPEALRVFLSGMSSFWLSHMRGFPYLFKLSTYSIAREPEELGPLLTAKRKPAVRSYEKMREDLEARLAEVDQEYDEAIHGTQDLEALQLLHERKREEKIEVTNRFLAAEFLTRYMNYELHQFSPPLDRLLEEGPSEETLALNQGLMKSLTELSKLILQTVFQIDSEYLQARYGKPSAPAAIVLGGSHSREEYPTFDYDAIFVYRSEGETSGGLEGKVTNKKFYDQLVRSVHETLSMVGRHYDARFQNMVFESYAKRHQISQETPWAISLPEAARALSDDASNRFRRVVTSLLATYGAGDSMLVQQFIQVLRQDTHTEEALKKAAVELYLSLKEEKEGEGEPIDIKHERGSLRTLHYLVWFPLVYQKLLELRGNGYREGEHSSFDPSKTDMLSLIEQRLDPDTAKRFQAYFIYLINLRFALDLFYARNDKFLSSDPETLSHFVHYGNVTTLDTSNLSAERISALFKGEVREIFRRIHKLSLQTIEDMLGGKVESLGVAQLKESPQLLNKEELDVLTQERILFPNEVGQALAPLIQDLSLPERENLKRSLHEYFFGKDFEARSQAEQTLARLLEPVIQGLRAGEEYMKEQSSQEALQRLNLLKTELGSYYGQDTGIGTHGLLRERLEKSLGFEPMEIYLSEKSEQVDPTTLMPAQPRIGTLVLFIVEHLWDLFQKVPIIVLELEGGQRVILNGHHRAAAAIRRGNPSVEAYVIKAKNLALRQLFPQTGLGNDLVNLEAQGILRITDLNITVPGYAQPSYQILRFGNFPRLGRAEVRASAEGGELVIEGDYGTAPGKTGEGLAAEYHASSAEEILFQGPVEEEIEKFKQLVKLTRENIQHIFPQDLHPDILSYLDRVVGIILRPIQRPEGKEKVFISNPVAQLIATIRADRERLMKSAPEGGIRGIMRPGTFDSLLDLVRSQSLLLARLVTYKDPHHPTREERKLAGTIAHEELRNAEAIIDRFLDEYQRIIDRANERSTKMRQDQQEDERMLEGYKLQSAETERRVEAEKKHLNQQIKRGKPVKDIRGNLERLEGLREELESEIQWNTGFLDQTRKNIRANEATATLFTAVLNIIQFEIKEKYWGNAKRKAETLRRILGNKENQYATRNLASLVFEDLLMAEPSGLYPQRRKRTEEIYKYQKAGQEERAQEREEFINRINDHIEVVKEIIAALVSSAERETETHRVELEDPQKNIILLVKEKLGMGTLMRIWAKFGPRIRGIITSQASPITHWVIISQGFRDPPPVVIVTGEKAKLLDQIKVGDPAIVSTADKSVVVRPDPTRRIRSVLDLSRQDLIQAMVRSRKDEPTPFGIKIKANVTPSERTGLTEMGADGIGLERTEIWDPAMEVLVNDRLVRHLAPEGIPVDIQDELRIAMFEEFHSLLTDPDLAGKEVAVRTLDIQEDKNERLVAHLRRMEQLKGVKPEEIRVTGFGFYRIPVGRQMLVQQLAAMYVAYAALPETMKKKPILQIMLPMVNNRRDLDYVQEVIVPEAMKIAVRDLVSPQTEMSGEAARKRIEAAFQAKQIMTGVMIETYEGLKNIRSILKHPWVQFENVGTNDLIIDLISQKRETKLGRDVAEQWELLSKFTQPITDALKELTAATAAHNRKQGSSVEICFCGQIAAAPKFMPFLHYLQREFQTPVSVSMPMSGIAWNKFILRLVSPKSNLSMFERPSLRQTDKSAEDLVDRLVQESPVYQKEVLKPLARQAAVLHRGLPGGAAESPSSGGTPRAEVRAGEVTFEVPEGVDRHERQLEELLRTRIRGVKDPTAFNRVELEWVRQGETTLRNMKLSTSDLRMEIPEKGKLTVYYPPDSKAGERSPFERELHKILGEISSTDSKAVDTGIQKALRITNRINLKFEKFGRKNQLVRVEGDKVVPHGLEPGNVLYLFKKPPQEPTEEIQPLPMLVAYVGARKQEKENLRIFETFFKDRNFVEIEERAFIQQIRDNEVGLLTRKPKEKKPAVVEKPVESTPAPDTPAVKKPSDTAEMPMPKPAEELKKIQRAIEHFLLQPAVLEHFDLSKGTAPVGALKQLLVDDVTSTDGEKRHRLQILIHYVTLKTGERRLRFELDPRKISNYAGLTDETLPFLRALIDRLTEDSTMQTEKMEEINQAGGFGPRIYELYREIEIPLLIQDLGDENLRQEAAAALAPRQEALPQLIEALEENQEPLVREGAAWALGKMGGSEVLKALQHAARSDTNTRVRKTAAAALKDLGKQKDSRSEMRSETAGEVLERFEKAVEEFIQAVQGIESLTGAERPKNLEVALAILRVNLPDKIMNGLTEAIAREMAEPEKAKAAGQALEKLSNWLGANLTANERDKYLTNPFPKAQEGVSTLGNLLLALRKSIYELPSLTRYQVEAELAPRSNEEFRQRLRNTVNRILEAIRNEAVARTAGRLIQSQSSEELKNLLKLVGLAQEVRAEEDILKALNVLKGQALKGKLPLTLEEATLETPMLFSIRETIDSLELAKPGRSEVREAGGRGVSATGGLVGAFERRDSAFVVRDFAREIGKGQFNQRNVFFDLTQLLQHFFNATRALAHIHEALAKYAKLALQVLQNDFDLAFSGIFGSVFSRFRHLMGEVSKSLKVDEILDKHPSIVMSRPITSEKSSLSRSDVSRTRWKSPFNSSTNVATSRAVNLSSSMPATLTHEGGVVNIKNNIKIGEEIASTVPASRSEVRAFVRQTEEFLSGEAFHRKLAELIAIAREERQSPGILKGDVPRFLREQVGIKRKQLGISPNMIEGIENGKKSPGFKSIVTMSQVLQAAYDGERRRFRPGRVEVQNILADVFQVEEALTGEPLRKFMNSLVQEGEVGKLSALLRRHKGLSSRPGRLTLERFDRLFQQEALALQRAYRKDPELHPTQIRRMLEEARKNFEARREKPEEMETPKISARKEKKSIQFGAGVSKSATLRVPQLSPALAHEPSRMRTQILIKILKVLLHPAKLEPYKAQDIWARFEQLMSAFGQLNDPDRWSLPDEVLDDMEDAFREALQHPDAKSFRSEHLNRIRAMNQYFQEWKSKNIGAFIKRPLRSEMRGIEDGTQYFKDHRETLWQIAREIYSHPLVTGNPFVELEGMKIYFDADLIKDWRQLGEGLAVQEFLSAFLGALTWKEEGSYHRHHPEGGIRDWLVYFKEIDARGTKIFYVESYSTPNFLNLIQRVREEQKECQGLCMEHSQALASKISLQYPGLKPHVMWGYFHSYDMPQEGEIKPFSTPTHAWVEVETKQGSFVIDAFPEGIMAAQAGIQTSLGPTGGVILPKESEIAKQFYQGVRSDLDWETFEPKTPDEIAAQRYYERILKRPPRSEARAKSLSELKPIENDQKIFLAKVTLEELSQEENGSRYLEFVEVSGGTLRLWDDGKMDYRAAKQKEYLPFNPNSAQGMKVWQKAKQAIAEFQPLFTEHPDRELLVAQIKGSRGRVVVIFPSGHGYWLSPRGLTRTPTVPVQGIEAMPVRDIAPDEILTAIPLIRRHIREGVRYLATEGLLQFIRTYGRMDLRHVDEARDLLRRIESSAARWPDILDAHEFVVNFHRSEARTEEQRKISGSGVFAGGRDNSSLGRRYKAGQPGYKESRLDSRYSSLSFPLVLKATAATNTLTYNMPPTMNNRKLNPSGLTTGPTTSQVRKTVLGLRRAHLATLKNPERDVLKVAEELGNMFLPKDFGIERLSGVIASLMNRLKTPEAIAAPDFGTFENVGHSIDQLLTPELLPKVQAMLGTPTQSKVKIGYIAGPTMLEKYGPALVALQKLYGPQTRIVVVIQGSPEIREAQMKIANALNKDLPAEQQILVRENPHSAAAILKNRYQIQGLGVSRTDADLLRQILDFNLSQSQNFVNNFVSSMPGLSALLAEWNVAFHHLLESAA